MAFISKVGHILRQTATKQVNAGLSASGPSIYQAICCMSSSKLFAGGISFSTDDSSLREAFGKYGEVIEARIIQDHVTGRSRGFGFDTYTSSEDASTAIQALDGQDIGGARKHQIGKSVSRKDKIYFLVNTLLDLKDGKESVYGALDAWVAWEKNFPIASLKKALLALEKEQEWHRVVQVIKWMLSKGQGTTMGIYEQLIRALDMDHRAEEAHMFWEKKIGMDLHSVPWQLCKLMISVYYRNNMLQNLIELFKGLEAFDRKPPEKSIVQKVADAYEVLGMLDEKERVLVKYDDLFMETAKGSPKKSRIASKRKNRSVDRKDVSSSNDVSSAASDVP